MEPVEDYQQQNPKVNRESTSETETHSPVALTSADEEAVNKVAEKIDTLRMAPRQVRMLKHHKEKTHFIIYFIFTRNMKWMIQLYS